MDPGNSPIKVNTDSGTATGLSADRLDGKNSTAVGREMWWAVVGSDGTLVRGRNAHGAPFTQKVGTGHYQVAFERTVTNCAYAATTNGNAGQTGVNPGSFDNWVELFTVTNDGTSADMAFHLIVAC